MREMMGTSGGEFPVSILDPSVDSGIGRLTCFGFELILARELAVAQRYGHYFSLLLIRCDSANGKSCLDNAWELAGRSIRRSDYIARLDSRTIGIILQHASASVAKKVVERLYSDVLSAFSDGQRRLSFSSAVFPTEANTVPTLKALTAKRLKEKALHFRSVSRTGVLGNGFKKNRTSCKWLFSGPT